MEIVYFNSLDEFLSFIWLKSGFFHHSKVTDFIIEKRIRTTTTQQIHSAYTVACEF